MSRYITLAAILLVRLASASEQPADGFRVRPQRFVPETMLAAPVPTGPVWHTLECMSPAKRANARLVLRDRSEDARTVEALWSEARYDEALQLLAELAPADLSVAWRNPLPAPRTDWDDDILVSARDSVVQVELDHHRTTGNLFCVLRYLGDGHAANWSVNLSTDGGLNWAETYTWWADYEVNDIDVSCLLNYAYAGFPGGPARDEALLYRFRAADGQHEVFPDSSPCKLVDSLGGADSIAEVALWSNADTTYLNRVYYALATNNHDLRCRWLDNEIYVVHSFYSQPDGVDRGLDFTWNHGFVCHYLLMSYIDTADFVRVWGVKHPGDTMEIVYYESQTSGGDYTSIAARGDTMLVLFDYQSSNMQCRYLARYGFAQRWWEGVLGDTTQGFTGRGDAAGRHGAGQGVVYWQYPQSTHGVCFTWRPYYGDWSVPERVQDDSTLRSCRPEIEVVDQDVFGVVFIRSGHGGQAWFDRSDRTGAAETPAERERRQALGPSIVRGVLSLATGRGAALVDAVGRQVMELQPGENDIRHLAPGVYFVRSADSGDASGGGVATRSAVSVRKVVIQR